MITSNPIPILEFDPSREPKIKATNIVTPCLPELCVITFFREALNKLAEEESLPLLAHLHSEVHDIPIYECTRNGQKIAVTMSFIGSAGAAGTLEELYAMGCRKFIVCGGAGSLRRETTAGQLILPTSAIRDEGASYHYLPPSREVFCPAEPLAKLETLLTKYQVPYIKGKTWTTDAFYRETPDKITLRRNEGCLTVEMEAATFFAVAEYHSISLAQILYAGDDVSGEQWDPRRWNKRYDLRQNLLSLAIDLVCEL